MAGVDSRIAVPPRNLARSWVRFRVRFRVSVKACTHNAENGSDFAARQPYAADNFIQCIPSNSENRVETNRNRIITTTDILYSTIL